VKASEIRDMSPDEQMQKLVDLKEELFNLRFQHEIGQLENTNNYQKYVRRRSRFAAHDENNDCRIGDKVLITESRPLSKRKKWRVVKIIEKAV